MANIAGSFDYITKMMESALEEARPLDVKGRVVQVVGTIIKAVIPGVKIGELCILRNPLDDDWELLAEVVGFAKQAALLTPLGELVGVSSATEVMPTGKTHSVPVAPDMLGRVIDGIGHPMDGRGALDAVDQYPVYGPPPNPMDRKVIDEPMVLGIRAIDSMLTCGRGQRMGIFAAAGGGKSTLLASIIRNTEADVIVLALIGERGREGR